MFALVGIGVNGIGSITLEGSDVFRRSDLVYLDGYTTPLPTGFVENFSRYIGKDIVVLDRAKLENNISMILKEARDKEISLAVLGDPLFATTHVNFLIQAKRMGVSFVVVHSTSISTLLATAFGLHPYKFGKIVTVVRESGMPATSIYFSLYDNLLRGLHTILLLEFDSKSGEGVTPTSMFKVLENAESVYKLGAFSEKTLVIVACRIAREDQKVHVGRVADLIATDFGAPPYSVIVPSKLHFTEEEALDVLFGLEKDKVMNNEAGLRGRTEFLVRKYVNRTRETLIEAREETTRKGLTNLDDLFENIECYLDDSTRFLNTGEDLLAMLSVGYAEGLLDSLRFQGILDLKW